MALMATAFTRAISRHPGLLARPVALAISFGVITYVAMNLIVVPLRFGTPLPPKTLSIVTQLFAHIVLVGAPFTWIARRSIAAAG
jgi:hypothetical protein